MFLEQENNYLIQTNLLEHWIDCHVIAPWLDKCFINVPNLEIIRGETQLKSSKQRKEQQSKGSKAYGKKVDLLIRTRGGNHELLVMESKKSDDETDQKNDKLKLQKEMKDMYDAQLKKFGYLEHSRIFGVQTSGFQVKIYQLDAINSDVYRFFELISFHLPQQIGEQSQNVDAIGYALELKKL